MYRALILAVVVGVSIAQSLLKQSKRGTFLWLLSDVAWSTPGRVKRPGWARSDLPRLTPKVHGWGYSLGRPAVARRLGLI
jgi:hypothetical protein